MKGINIVYDNNEEDVDIVTVPDYVSDNISAVVQEFFDWLDLNDTHEYWMTDSNGLKYLEIETVAFIKWVNTFYGGNETEKSGLVLAHTKLNKNYDCAEF